MKIRVRLRVGVIVRVCVVRKTVALLSFAEGGKDKRSKGRYESFSEVQDGPGQ